MHYSTSRFNVALIFVGTTLLFPLVLQFPYALYDLIMSQFVSVVWADLHRTAYDLGKMLFVYGFSAALVFLFLTKLRIDERLQPQYASGNLWMLGCLLALVGVGLNLLIAIDVVNLLELSVSNKKWIAITQIVAKIVLLVAVVRMLIGVSPMVSK
jgi:hypothetical protein